MNIENIEKSVKKSRILVTVIFGLTVGIYMLWFFVFQNQGISTDSSQWGSFGDFVGGLLNPLIAYSAFYWLTVSVLVQKQELTETKQALIDSSKAQQEQVDVAHRKAKMDAINMRFIKLNITLEAELNYRNTLIEKGMSNGIYQRSLDKSGNVIMPKDELPNCNELIAELEASQHLLIKQVDELTNKT